VLDQALAQIPDPYRHGHPILIRADGAGCSKAFLAHVRSLHEQGVNCEFSVGWTITEREHTAIAALDATDWTPVVDTDGQPRPLDKAAVAEITGLLPSQALADYPTGTRVNVRRERPHPGAQLDAFEERDGYRYTAFATTPASARTPGSMPATAPTPESKTASAAAGPPGWAGYPAAPSPSTPPG
jgi:hypothetical protein